jgi:glycosyltransferase involved in cell wall biosynthesis
MACGCAVVGSDTAPVREVIRDGHNGLLVNFFSPGDVAEAVADLLQNRPRARALGDAARRHVEQLYDREVCVARQLALMDLVASRSIAG